MEKSKIQIMEEATAIVAMKLFENKYPGLNASEATKLVQDCVNDTTFIVNTFMRVSADIAREELGKHTTAGE